MQNQLSFVAQVKTTLWYQWHDCGHFSPDYDERCLQTKGLFPTKLIVHVSKIFFIGFGFSDDYNWRRVTWHWSVRGIFESMFFVSCSTLLRTVSFPSFCYAGRKLFDISVFKVVLLMFQRVACKLLRKNVAKL